MQYVQDYDEYFPSQYGTQVDNYASTNTQNWIGDVYPYVKSWDVFVCPDATPEQGGAAPYGNNHCSYKVNGVLIGMNNWPTHFPAVSMAALQQPASLIFLHEYGTSTEQAQLSPSPSLGLTEKYQFWLGGNPVQADVFDKLHSMGTNLLYADGHAHWKAKEAICTRDFGLDMPTCGTASMNESISLSQNWFQGVPKYTDYIQ
jgi:prepilin-type processing-associated H-X9-DG protein